MPIMIPYFGLHRLCQNNIDRGANSMPIFKNITTFTLCAGMVLASASLWAQDASVQQPTEKPVKPYGKNPNIFHVWAYKTQEGVLNTAEKVGTAAERGIAKVKPSVGQAWDNTKDIAGNTVQKADAGAQKATQSVNTKIQETKEALAGKPSQVAPIEQHRLSESSSSLNSNQAVPHTAIPSSSTTTAYPVNDL